MKSIYLSLYILFIFYSANEQHPLLITDTISKKNINLNLSSGTKYFYDVKPANTFEVNSSNSSLLNYQGRKEVMQVMPMHPMRLVTKIEDYADDNMPYKYHYHMLTNEDIGMKGQFIVSTAITSTKKDKGTKNDVSLFTNPCNKEQFRKIISEIPKKEISIINIVGQEIYDEIENGKSVNITPSLREGLYFVIIKTENKTTTRKVVIE
jgi:hypothetical protein